MEWIGVKCKKKKLNWKGLHHTFVYLIIYLFYSVGYYTLYC